MEKQEQNLKWERTGDIVGHQPLFSINCEFCDKPMIHRYSQILFDPKMLKMTFLRKLFARIANKLRLTAIPNDVGDPSSNTIEYKCTLCGNVVIFDIMDDKDYLQFILEKRNNVPLYYPPTSEWADESEEIKNKLKSLGYV